MNSGLARMRACRSTGRGLPGPKEFTPRLVAAPGPISFQTLRQPNRQRLADDRRAWRRTLRIGVATRQGGGDRRQRTTQAIPWCS
jgi:hypothetical protein